MASLDIPWSGGAVPATLEARGSGAGVLLAPGAGAGQDHPFMVAVRDGLATRGVTTMSFDYAYRAAGRRAPDRLRKLLDVHEAACRRLLDEVDTVVLVGKSMGGRVGSHLVGGVDGQPGRISGAAGGLAYLGYPLVPVGKTEPRAVNHLHRIAAPQLFVAGTRDRFGPLDFLRPVVEALPDAELHLIEGANHGFHVTKASGLTDDDVLEEILDVVATFVAQPGGGT